MRGSAHAATEAVDRDPEAAFLVFDPQLRTMSSSRSYRRTLLLIALAASLAVGSSVASGSENLKKALVVSVRVPSRPD